MFIPFIFTLDTQAESENYFHWRQFYLYASACIQNEWPIIAHERYFHRLSQMEEFVFGYAMKDVASLFKMQKLPTTKEMLALKKYPISQEKEDSLISEYPSQFDCWIDLLVNDNPFFEQIITTILEKIIVELGETPEGILVYEYLPISLKNAAQKKNIPIIFQAGGLLRPPFSSEMTAFCLLNDNGADAVYSKYHAFMSQSAHLPILSHKSALKLFVSEQYLQDIHHIDNEPVFDAGILCASIKTALLHVDANYLTDKEMVVKAKEHFKKITVRTRPGTQALPGTQDDSPTCFHFCCKCEHVVGIATKGMFEAMLAKRIPHEYSTSFFHKFCNHSMEDNRKGLAPLELINFALFGMSVPFSWITTPEYLRFFLSSSEKEQYIRGLSYFTRKISKEDLDYYYLPSLDRVYRLGDPLYFSQGHLPHQNALFFCKEGLNTLESSHTWSKGKKTVFDFDLVELPEEDLLCRVALKNVMFDDSKHDFLQMRCEVNGATCFDRQLTYQSKFITFTIPQRLVSQTLSIVFYYKNPQLLSEESRYVALAFEAMQIDKASECSSENTLWNKVVLEENNLILKAKQVDLESGCSLLQAEKQWLEKAAQTLTNEKYALQEQYSALDSKLQTKIKDYDILQAEKLWLEKTSQTLLHEKNSLQAGYEMLQTEKVWLEKTSQTLLHEKNSLQAGYEMLQTDYQALTTDKNELDSLYEALQEERNQYQQELQYIRQSRLYRWIVKPIWTIHEKIKRK